MGDYFCGWYWKFQNGRQTVAVIPAYHIAGKEKSCSVQLITGSGAWNIPFAFGAFHQEQNNIQIGDNRFSRQGVRLNLHGPGLDAVGELNVGPFDPIAYDIMGPFRYVPFMQCRHSVFSMQHRVRGWLRINGEIIPFDDGWGYLEGDRGHSFPKEYLWTQCCYPKGSVMLSVAGIPFCGLHFTGVIGVIHHLGKEYRLCTYLGARAIRICDGEAEICQGKNTLTVRRMEQKGFPLAAPIGGKMSRTIHESAVSRVYYHFQIRGKTVFELESDQASFEYEFPR